MNSRQHIVTTAARKRARGFSLVEVLTVVAIIAIMMSLMAPAISGFSSTAGRRGAVNLVMNTIDQARVAALEQGREVHVIFAKRPFPEPSWIQVLREVDSTTPGGVKTLEPLTRVITLPKGVTLVNRYIVAQGPTSEVENYIDASGKRDEFEAVGVLKFTPRGTVSHPNGSGNNRRIELSDSARYQANNDPADYGFDIISVARYTGRPQLDVTFQ